MDDQDGNGAVVEDVVADAAKEGAADCAAAARAHCDQVVPAAVDLLDQRGADGLVGEDGGDGDLVGDAVACAAQLGFRGCESVGVDLGGRPAAGTE
jgi:hypothetical protein